MVGYKKIEISIFDLRFCPYCGTKIEKSTFEHPGDDVICEGIYHEGICPKCKKIKYSK